MEKKTRTKIVKLKTALTAVISNQYLSESDNDNAVKAYEMCDSILIGKFDTMNEIAGDSVMRANFLKHSKVLKKSKNKVLFRVGEELEKMGKKTK